MYCVVHMSKIKQADVLYLMIAVCIPSEMIQKGKWPRIVFNRLAGISYTLNSHRRPPPPPP